MARLRILELPGDGSPFVVIFDRIRDPERLGLHEDGAPLRELLGARAIIVSESEDIELAGDEP